ncbi:MAG TPA: hypothetical protein EYP88_04195, partial [Anaerolineales bacterium]|nr:hypothetical protein [Anaerolineales bacterium]
MNNFINTTTQILTALLKHQAKLLLGKDAAGILSNALIDEELQKRLDNWLEGRETRERLEKAAEQARIYLQNPQNCPDEDLRKLFHSLDFGDLPSVLAEIAKLPQAMDLSGLQNALQAAFERVKHLTPQQQVEGARLYTEALLRAASTLKEFSADAIRLMVFDIYGAVAQRGEEHGEMLALVQEIKTLLLEWIRPSKVTLPSPAETLPGRLPPGSHLPLERNAIFTGREAHLERLAEALCPALPDDEARGDSQAAEAVIVTQAVTGMGGIGKTQLAVEFAYRYGYRFRGVHWLNAAQARTFEDIYPALAECGKAMRLAGFPEDNISAQASAQAKETLAAWAGNAGPRLVIVDNLKDAAAAAAILPRLRQIPALRLLLTSRYRDWPKHMQLNPIPL